MLSYLTVISAIVPSMLLLWYFHSRDIYPEPPVVLWTTFGLGILTTLPTLAMALPLSYYLDASLVGSPYFLGLSKSFLTAAIPEEFYKLMVLLLYCSRHKEFDEPMDGVVYGVAASLGFATLENVLYALSGGLTLSMMRAVTAVPGHAFLGAIMGYFVGQARFKLGDRKHLLLCAFGIPVLFHGLYDFPLLTIHALGVPVWGARFTVLLAFSITILIIELVWALKLVQKLREEQMALHDPGSGESMILWDSAGPLGALLEPIGGRSWLAWTFTMLGGISATAGGMLTLGLGLAFLLESPASIAVNEWLIRGSLIGLVPLLLGVLLFSMGLRELNKMDTPPPGLESWSSSQ